MSTGRYINGVGIKAYRKPLAEEEKDILSAIKQDQRAAFFRLWRTSQTGQDMDYCPPRLHRQSRIVRRKGRGGIRTWRR